MITKEFLDKLQTEIDAMLDSETDETLLDWLNNRHKQLLQQTQCCRQLKSNEMLKNLKFWFKKEFGVLTLAECQSLGFEHSHNIYGDEINHINCRSIWRDKKGKSYRCESLYEVNYGSALGW